MSTSLTRARTSTAARLRRDRVLVLDGVPGLAALLAFHYLPLLGNIIAFEDYQPFLGIIGSQWAGLREVRRSSSTATRTSSTR